MTCLSCHKLSRQMTWKSLFLMTNDYSLCHSCYSKLKQIDLLKTCKKCCAQTEKTICDDCITWNNDPLSNQLLIKNISLYKYNDFLKELISQWKYRGDYVLANAFKKDFNLQFKRHFSKENDLIIVPIPLSNERLNERGFNQSLQLATLLTDKPVTLLRRIDTEKQAKKSRKERLARTNPFVCNKRIQSSVLLVDDIYTTGATIYAASKRLKERGCPKVYSLTLARG